MRQATRSPTRILIDTSGYGPADRDRELRLHQTLAGCEGLEAHLTLSATERGGRPALTTALVPQAVVFTRLDETDAPGALLDESLRLGLPISFLTAGQNCLRDLIRADPADLTRLAWGAGRRLFEPRVRAAAAEDGNDELSPSG